MLTRADPLRMARSTYVAARAWLGRCVLVCVSCLSCVALQVVGTAGASAQVPLGASRSLSPNGVEQSRQTWVWHFGDPVALATTAFQAHVDELLVWVSPGATSMPAKMREFTQLRTLAAAKGEVLVALCGDPSWATNPAAAGSWAREVAHTGLFRRIHLDIEPHALPQWKTRSAPLAQGLLMAISAAKAAGLPTDVDIPYWYNTVKLQSGALLDEAVMQTADGITIMSYQHTAANIVSVSAIEMGHASELRVPAHIGINLIPAGADGPTSSLFGQSAATISKVVGQVQAAGRQWRSFAGLALHDSDYLAGIAG
jgi:hypothetical protein